MAENISEENSLRGRTLKKIWRALNKAEPVHPVERGAKELKCIYLLAMTQGQVSSLLSLNIRRSAQKWEPFITFVSSVTVFIFSGWFKWREIWLNLKFCYFIKLSPKLLNSFEKSSGLLEIYLEHLKIHLSLKFKSLVSLPNIITYIWLSMSNKKHDYHHHLLRDFYRTRHNANPFTELIASHPHHLIRKDLLN